MRIFSIFLFCWAIGFCAVAVAENPTTASSSELPAALQALDIQDGDLLTTEEAHSVRGGDWIPAYNYYPDWYWTYYYNWYYQQPWWRRPVF